MRSPLLGGTAGAGAPIPLPPLPSSQTACQHPESFSVVIELLFILNISVPGEPRQWAQLCTSTAGRRWETQTPAKIPPAACVLLRALQQISDPHEQPEMVYR